MISYLGSKVMTFNISQNLIGYQPNLHKILRNTSKAGLSVGLLGSIIAIGNGLGNFKRLNYFRFSMGNELILKEYTKILEKFKEMEKNLDDFSVDEQQKILGVISSVEGCIKQHSHFENNLEITKKLLSEDDSYLSRLNIIIDPHSKYVNFVNREIFLDSYINPNKNTH